MAARTMTPRGLVPLVDRLVTLRPGNAQAQEICATLEHSLMKAVTAGGARAADRAIAALNRRGHQFTLAETLGTIRRWREPLADGKRVIEISVNVNRHFKSTAVKYLSVREPPRLTRRQRAIHSVQEAFYAKYMAAGRTADAKGRLGRGDRLALLIGELEADVNNGGFDQYLGNKGRRRARAALAALRAVGARKTAAMLAGRWRRRRARPSTLRSTTASTGSPRTWPCSRRDTWGFARLHPAPASTRPARRAR
jgi:hypothetical protein